MMCEWGAALEAAWKNKEQAWEDESVTMSVAAKMWSEWVCTTKGARDNLGWQAGSCLRTRMNGKQKVRGQCQIVWKASIDY